ncbi:MAG: metallophosphoesterase [Candidatus Bathyarchaeia archaeon]
MATKIRLFFATDVHGSEKCFLKFLNTPQPYKVNTLILGGDVTGKMIVPIVKTAEGTYTSEFLSSKYTLKSDKEVEDLEKKIRFTGYYPYRTTEDEMSEMRADPTKVDAVFTDVMIETLRRWMGMAEERLKGKGIKVFMTGGNDDRPEIEDVLKSSNYVVDPEGELLTLEGGYEMVSSGWSNPTPWKTPRECSEEDLAAKLDAMTSKVQDMSNCIFNLHVPPYDTGLDTCPKLDENLKPVYAGSEIMMISAGSTAVRNAIEKYQPLLGLHGHIHESRGFIKIGQTLCLNPGSEYTEGMLRGVVVELDDKKVRSYLLTVG